MYCTMNVTFRVKGDAEEALPKLQAMLDDIEELIAKKHSSIESPQFDEHLTPDDVHENPDSPQDLEG